MIKTIDEYRSLSPEQLDQRIREIKKAMGNKLVILGHHYQKDEVFQYADHTGDSLKLAQMAAQEKDAEFIVFCGVHFMAETADILTKPEQKVILPDLSAGCSMAEMADLEQAEECWNTLKAKYGIDIVPVTYVNSTAEIKAFCGRNGGMTCTSSNATRIFKSILDQNKAILFLPDEYLGTNTGLAYGLEPEEILLWDSENGTLEGDLPENPPRLIVWDGFCCVHKSFKTEHIRTMREKYKELQVIVHPECPHELVELADANGSTEYIIRAVTEAPAGSVWAVGTESNLVRRLAKENPDKTVFSLSGVGRSCISMNRIQQPELLWILDNLNSGNIINQISVDSETASQAILALNRMLELS